MKNGISEIDDKHFFLSPKGKTNAKAELNATLYALLHETKLDDNATACKFPARKAWLVDKLQIGNLPLIECKAYQKVITKLNPTSATIVFPSAHINSPASMFGHTFLRLDDAQGLALTSRAVNYAAKSREKNGLLFAYKGLFGGYQGRYSLLPYYQKIKEYNNLEGRDIWEYTLNLKPKEIGRLLTHLYALRDVWSDYYFMRENCSYNLLWLLEVARKDVHLVNQFSIKAIPLDTIRAMKVSGMIERVHFRPSKRKELLVLAKALKGADGEVKEAYRAALDVGLLQLKRATSKIDKKAYVKELMLHLKKRSRLPTFKKLEVVRPQNPLKGHKSTRVMFGVDDDGSLLFGAKLAYHDIYDVTEGFVDGAYLDFLHLELEKKHDESVHLKTFDFVNIKSYAPINNIVNALSWEMSLGVDAIDAGYRLRMRGALGYSVSLGEGVFGFLMLQPSVYYHDSVLVSLSPKLGMIANFEKLSVGVLAEKGFFSDGTRDVHGEFFVTKKVGKDWALNLKINEDKISHQKSRLGFRASCFYYF